MSVPQTPHGLAGRDDEVAAIAGMLAGNGTPALAFVGEAGIGKTALLAHAERAALEAGHRVITGRAADHERDVPFGLVVDAFDDVAAQVADTRLQSLGAQRLADLAALLPSLSDHASAIEGRPGAAERFRYHRALAALLTMLAGERPIALVLDDVHWADEGSLEFLLHLLRRSPEGVVLVLGMRPVDPTPRVLDGVRGCPGAEAITLGPLDADASLTLLAEIDDEAVRGRVAREAGGHPLFLLELARAAPAADDPLPATLRAAIQREVEQLPPASRALLEGAAVAGDPCELDLAIAGADIDPDDALGPLDHLVAADLLRAVAGRRRFGFRHPLVHRAVFESAAPGWLLGAHEQVDRVLAARGAAAVARAFHVEQYARPGDEQARAVLTEAGHAAFDASPASAARWFDAALALVPAAEGGRRVELLAPLALALASAGRFAESRDALLQALDLVDPAAMPELHLILTVGCAQEEQMLGRYEEARAAGRRVRRTGARRSRSGCARGGTGQRSGVHAQSRGADRLGRARSGQRR